MKLKSFYDTLLGVATDFEKTFEKKAVDHNADGDQAFRDAEKVGTDDQTTATDEARNQGEFGKQPKWKDVKDLEDKARKTIPKVTQAGKFVWLKLLGGIAVVGVVFTHLSHWSPEDSNRVAEQRIQQSFNSYRVDKDQFNIMVGSLAFPSPVPAPAPMPMAVAEVASEPVEVEVRWPRLSEQRFRVDKWSVCRG
jgi:hypothetical protein